MDQPMGNPPKKSGGALKWILLGCGGIILLIVAFFGISGYLVYRSFNTDPAKVETTAQEILPFQKPEGYKGMFSMSVMGVKMAALSAGEQGAGGSIVLVAVPAGTNQEQMRAQMKANMEKQGQSQEVIEKRKNESFKVRGKAVDSMVDVVASKGSGDARMHQYTLSVDGPSGQPVLMVITGPEKQVDHDWVQKLLDTVK